MKKHIIFNKISLLLTLIFIFQININVHAQNSRQKMNPFIEDYDSINSTKETIFDEPIESLPTSLGIKTINIDTQNLHDTNPLSEADINLLTDKGYSYKEVRLMDRGDFLQIRNKWKLSKEEIKLAKSIYNDLKNKDISNWTYGEFIDYCKMTDKQKYSPTISQIKKFNERGITLADARYMLKDYLNYENILKKSDKEIKNYLKEYYEFKQDYLKALNIIESNKLLVLENNEYDSDNPMDYPYKDINGARYYEVYMPGYGYDYFHKDSGTQYHSAPMYYASAANQLYKKIYNTTNDYKATNMYGTSAKSHDYNAHEGIDFVGKPVGGPVRAICNGTATKTSSNWGLVALDIVDKSDEKYRVFYMHMLKIEPDGSVNSGDTLGQEGGRGVKDGVVTDTAFGKHLHIQVYCNRKPDHCDTSKNNKLESDSPYGIEL